MKRQQVSIEICPECRVMFSARTQQKMDSITLYKTCPNGHASTSQALVKCRNDLGIKGGRFWVEVEPDTTESVKQSHRRMEAEEGLIAMLDAYNVTLMQLPENSLARDIVERGFGHVPDLAWRILKLAQKRKNVGHDVDES